MKKLLLGVVLGLLPLLAQAFSYIDMNDQSGVLPGGSHSLACTYTVDYSGFAAGDANGFGCMAKQSWASPESYNHPAPGDSTEVQFESVTYGTGASGIISWGANDSAVCNNQQWGAAAMSCGVRWSNFPGATANVVYTITVVMNLRDTATHTIQSTATITFRMRKCSGVVWLTCSPTS